MLARLVNDTWIYLANVTPVEDQLLSQHFSAFVPGFRFIDTGDATGKWDGVYRRYDLGKKRLARPFLAELRKVCAEQNLILQINDERPPPAYRPPDPETIGPDFLPGVTLEDYQVRAVRAACRAEVGIIELPTGGGKTEVMCAITRMMDCPTIIIAEQRVVLDQIKARLELRQVAEEVGLFYAGRRPNGQTVVVGSIQCLQTPKRRPEPPQRRAAESDAAWARRQRKYEATLKGYRTRSRSAKVLQDLVKRMHMLIVDECDLATSAMYAPLFRYWFQGRRRYGFSGTPFDPAKPVQNLILRERLGSVIAREDRQAVEAAGRIIPITFYMLAVNEGGDRDEASAFDLAFDEHVVHNQVVHRLIAGICRTYPDDGTLILVDRDDLGHALVERIPGARFIHGRTTKTVRTSVLRAFERRELKVLIGGKIINRGLDLNGGCENLILATSGKMWSKLNQAIGRAVRLNARGQGRVFGFYHMHNRYLYDHSRANLKAVLGLGYRAEVIFSNGRIDGEQLVRSRFRLPRGLGVARAV